MVDTQKPPRDGDDKQDGAQGDTPAAPAAPVPTPAPEVRVSFSMPPASEDIAPPVTMPESPAPESESPAPDEAAPESTAPEPPADESPPPEYENLSAEQSGGFMMFKAQKNRQAPTGETATRTLPPAPADTTELGRLMARIIRNVATREMEAVAEAALRDAVRRALAMAEAASRRHTP